MVCTTSFMFKSNHFVFIQFPFNTFKINIWSQFSQIRVGRHLYATKQLVAAKITRSSSNTNLTAKNSATNA